MSELNSQNFDQAISSSEKCMIDFYATWCGPCKAMNPVLESAETDLGEGKIYKVDVDKNRDLVEKFGKSGVIPKGLILEYLN